MAFGRAILGILAGYLVMAGAAMGVVSSLYGEGAEPTGKNVIIGLVAVAIGAGIGGFLCTLIVGSANHPAIYITLGLMIAVTVQAHFTGRALEPDGYKILAVISQIVGFMIGASAAGSRINS